MTEPHGLPPLLEVRAVSLAYGGVTALDRLTVTVDGPGLIGIMGANGAGKSSLFNVVSGLSPATDGEVRLLGERLSGRPAWQVARAGIARTFQNLRLLAHLSVRDNLLVACSALGDGLFVSAFFGGRQAARHAERMRARAERLLGALGLLDAADAPALSLPYGLKRRLEIGRALMMQPKLLLLDEPAAGMNASEKRQLAALLPRLLVGVSALIIEHDLQFLRALCRRLWVLHHGRLLAEGVPAAVANDARVRELYFGASPS